MSLQSRQHSRTFGSAAFLGVAILAQSAVAQYPGGLGPPLYVGRPDYFSGSRPTHVMGQQVPSNAIGYTILPNGGGLRWEYGGAAPQAVARPALPQSVPSVPSVAAQGGSSSLDASSKGAPYYFAGAVRYASVNGVRTPDDAIGYQMDFRAGRPIWLYTNPTASSDAVAVKPSKPVQPSAPVAVAPLKPVVPIPVKPAIVEETAEEKLAKQQAAKVRELRIAALDLNQYATVSDAAKKNAADAAARIGSSYADFPVAPVAVDPDDDKAIDSWVHTNSSSKSRRLQALFLLSQPTTIEALGTKQVLWNGRCVDPKSSSKEDAAIFAFFPNGRAPVGLLTHIVDPKNGSPMSDASYSVLEAFGPNEMTYQAKAAATQVPRFTALAMVETDEKKKEVEFQWATGNPYGTPLVYRVRKLGLAREEVITMQVSYVDDKKVIRPFSYCLFAKKWTF